MGRTVISAKDFKSSMYAAWKIKSPSATDVSYSEMRDSYPSPPEIDKYASRLIKYIPVEVITLYLTLDALVRSSATIPHSIYWSIFIVGVLGTYLYLWRVEKVNKQKQLAISVGAYCVWVFALGGPFEFFSWYNSIYGGLLLPIYTFFIAIIEA